MPHLIPVYVSDDENDKIRQICKTLDCTTYGYQKACILLGFKNYAQLKEEIKKVKSKDRGVKSAERRREKGKGIIEDID